MRFSLLLILLTAKIFALGDDDLDGVNNDRDRCKNTPFSDLVDASGCSVTSLSSNHRFGINIGLLFSELDQDIFQEKNTLYQTYQIDYKYEDISVTISSATYRQDDKVGMSDTYLTMSYSYDITDSIIIVPSIAFIFPTYDTGYSNEKTDVETGLELHFTYDKYLFFGRVSYAFINDKNVGELIYQNGSGLSLGMSRNITDRLDMSLAYNEQKSIYKYEKEIQSGALFLYYSLNENYYVTSGYSYGLSDLASKHLLSLSIGYNF